MSEFSRSHWDLGPPATLAQHEMMLRIAAESPNFVVARFRDKEESETQEEYDGYRDDIVAMIAEEALRPQDQTELE